MPKEYLIPWEALLDRLPVVEGLAPEEDRRLIALAETFLEKKKLDPVAGLTMDDSMRRAAALIACLPILNLGLPLYDNWQTLIFYPYASFTLPEGVLDASGVVVTDRPVDGVAWPNGPVVVSWLSIEKELENGWEHAGNVLIHELAHQLDFRSGFFNGQPPLGTGMDQGVWHRVFSAAFDHLNDLLDREEPSVIFPDAGDNPAEFFAVVAEMFFSGPELLIQAYPDVYAQLVLLFRQDPYKRLYPDKT